MTVKTCIIKPKRNAGLNTLTRSLLKSETGSGMGIILLGITVMLLILLVFVNIADYALYSTKRNMISKGIDYGVCAAIQEVGGLESEIGLAAGFDEATGKAMTDNIVLNETNADNAFYTTLQSNTGIPRERIKGNTLTVIVNPTDSALDYIIKKDTQRFEGSVSSPSGLEAVINNAINQCWDNTDPLNDRQVIYVNRNLKTNQFKKSPYYIVFIKNYEIDGLFKKRTATFVDFAGAKIERKK